MTFKLIFSALAIRCIRFAAVIIIALWLNVQLGDTLLDGHRIFDFDFDLKP